LTTEIAQIVMESFLKGKTNFCCCKKATKGSTFYGEQK